MVSNTQRTLKYLRELGYTAGMVEKWNPYAHIRQDLFGIIDIVAMGAGVLLGVQSCGDSGRAEHRRKLLGSANSLKWLQTGSGLWLVTWGKHKGKEKGDRRLKWRPFVEKITFPQVYEFREGEE